MKTNNYPSWLVPIETAKKLKEIGFDKPTQNNTSDYVLESKRYKDENKLYSNEYVLKGLYNANETKEGLSIPTWEQVLDWFREKGFESYIKLESHSHLDEANYYYFEITDPNLCQLDYQGDFDDYSVARETLINKLIEIYEDNLQSRTRGV